MTVFILFEFGFINNSIRKSLFKRINLLTYQSNCKFTDFQFCDNVRGY